MYYLILLASVFGIAVNFCFNKVYQLKVPQSMDMAFFKAVPTSLLSAVMFWLMSGFSLEFSGFTALMSVLMAAVGLLSTCICFIGYGCGSIAVFTLFQMSGGMLLPFIYGIFYGNTVSVYKIIGIFLMIVSLVFPVINSDKNNKNHFSPKYLICCVLIFLINGSVSVISYIYSNSPATTGSYSFLVLKSLLTAVFAAAAYAVYKNIPGKTGKAQLPAVFSGKRTSAIIILLLAGITAADGISYLLQLVSASHLPAVALYPFVTGGAVVFTAIAGRLLFKEKLTKKAVAGILMTCVATVLFMF